MTDIELQMKLEADSVHDGALRYAQSYEYHRATDSKPVSDLLGYVLKPLADAIRALQLELKTQQKLPKYGLPLLSLNPDALGLITVGVLFNGITRSEFNEGTAPGLASVSYEVGERCRTEIKSDCARNRSIDVAGELMPRNRSRHAARRAKELAQKRDDDDDWKANYRSFHLGEKLITLAVRHAQFEGTPLFELKTFRESGSQRTRTTISLTDAACDWIAEHQPALESLLSPVYQPMVVRPRPWTSLSGGGYLIHPLELMKRQPNKQAQRLLKKADLTPVLSAVNAMQNTAFRINKDIHRDMRPAWDGGQPFFGFETLSLKKLPPRLPDDADPGQIHERKRERAGAYKLNSRIKGMKTVMPSRLAVAERFLDRPQIYFPHQLDHRGRAYPVPQLVNPQSDHIGRAYLEFADGKPLGERGPYWLAIQLANCYGKDKLSFDERMNWVLQNEQDILAFAGDPLHGHRFWKEAKKPWLVRAACKEWKGYREQGRDFRSHLVVSMDGTCNGYQHLSAMGRDPIGGRATNLVPGFKPADIYQEVADLASWRIARDAGDPNCPDEYWARQLLRKIDRHVAKHATMTTPYGVTRGTIYKELLKTEAVISCINPPECARYLAKVLEESIPQVAIEAGKIMAWLQNVAYLLGKANRPIGWTTPTGFYVVHAVRERKTARVTTSDHTFNVFEEDEKRKIDWRKQVDGIVAHFVHSMDAAHMMLTINRLVAAGIHHFAMVHDSFGVHAADVDLLNRVLREEFVRIYAEPVLHRFLEEQRLAHPDVVLPEPPESGNLDIRHVIESLYFFA